MPFTPLHYPAGYIISKLDKRLSLPGLVVGSVIPDIEVPLMWIFFPGIWDHLLFHSLLGVFTVCTLLAVVATHFLYPPIISLFFGVDKEKLTEACAVTPAMVFSCMLGALVHVLVDIPMHPFNSIFFPWVSPNDIAGFAVLFFAEGGDLILGYIRANLLFSSIMIALGILIVIANWGDDIWEQLWLGFGTSSMNDENQDLTGINHSSSEI